MMPEAVLTLAILGVTIVLFVSDRLRLDVVAMMSLLALTLSGVTTVPDALAGFSNPAVLMIAGLFIVGAALTDTGVADWPDLVLVAEPDAPSAVFVDRRRALAAVGVTLGMLVVMAF
ncbi:SLC13 family permease [Sorangium sp. So ce1153]|uniref:SLC13 family permease n=1 Tax=Sorangium sp. So ce1153 TaxID=3133333 RepID=UPI003F5ECB08